MSAAEGEVILLQMCDTYKHVHKNTLVIIKIFSLTQMEQRLFKHS